VYPIRLGYVNTIRSWWPGTNVLAGMGVPGYNSKEFPYNYIVLTFWIDQPVDMVKVWSDPVTYIGTTTEFGTTKAELQKNIKKRYNEAGIKLLISAFGGTTHPTTFGNDPKSTAEDLADFVANNNLDGVDVDWEDSAAMERGTGEEWLITFTTILRQKLPNHIITHAPQAPYFVDNLRKYPNGAYLTVNKKVGHMIDFYNVQFYNQGNTRYDTYELLFKESKGYFPGTSVEELIDIGIPAEKIVVGKPATRADVYNTGYVDASDLGNWTARYFEENSNWYAGVMFWQLKSDI
jgi:chitinase